jgi:surfeit locus 1 family protein
MRFRPSFKLSLILITLAAVFLRLGLWQLDRKAEKAALFERFASAPAMAVKEALAGSHEFARVEAVGRYDPERHLLLDNRIWNGRAGVHALTPFRLADGRLLLVNRGWLPLAADRSALPAVPTDPTLRTIHGRMVLPPAAGPRLGEPDVLSADRWPQLTTYFDLPAVSAALAEPLEPWVLQLDPGDASGFGDRQWSPAVMEPSVHGAYAVQWLALCAAALAIWIILGLRHGRRPARRPDDPATAKPGNPNP